MRSRGRRCIAILRVRLRIKALEEVTQRRVYVPLEGKEKANKLLGI